jgi:hypothetical protein
MTFTAKLLGATATAALFTSAAMAGGLDRSGQPVNALFEEGRHLWAMVYLLHSFFGRDGREEADELLMRHSGDADKPRILQAFNVPIEDWLSFFMFLGLTVTGVLLMFYYRTTIEWAYADILALRDVTSLGILRELHRWGAHAMVITVWLHMLRVFLTGSYKPPREFNWNVGVIMLVLTLLLSFTGYLLPWDQLAIWAITVGSNMARAS